MSGKASKRPRDANQLAKSVVDQATGAVEDTKSDEDAKKNPAAVALGSLGGKLGGAARAKSLPPERRSEIAKQAAKARWKKKK